MAEESVDFVDGGEAEGVAAFESALFGGGDAEAEEPEAKETEIANDDADDLGGEEPEAEGDEPKPEAKAKPEAEEDAGEGTEAEGDDAAAQFDAPLTVKLANGRTANVSLNQVLEAYEGAHGDQALLNMEVTATIRGEEVTVPISEAIMGYQRNSDYTKSKQELAETSRTLQAEHAQSMEQLKAALEVYALPSSKEPKVEDFDGRPEEFVKAFQDYQAQSHQEKVVAETLAKIKHEETQAIAVRENAALLAKIPDWEDAEVRQADEKAIIELAMDRYGFNQEEVTGFMDHRIWHLCRDLLRVAKLDETPVLKQRRVKLQTPARSSDAPTPKQKQRVDRKKATARIQSGQDPSDEDLMAAFF